MSYIIRLVPKYQPHKAKKRARTIGSKEAAFPGVVEAKTGKPRGRAIVSTETPERRTRGRERNAGGPRRFSLFMAVLRKINPARIHEKGANFMKRISYTIKSSYRPLRGRRA